MKEKINKLLNTLETFFRYYRDVDSEPDIKWEKVNKLKEDVKELFKEELNHTYDAKEHESYT